ncbi:MAG: ABC transporter substrate-binding protein [Dehalococcoidia bacterium]|nr:ABC transporter substrate-binding protein [Dehalococcoidia bacterium]MDD5494665.1 ABC transporter substrate-binding protein [Dehalococcoidia bacterium]
MKQITLPVLAISLIFVTGCAFGPSAPAPVLQPVSLQLQWITQAQFAGYYVALDKGWYREEGLDLTIRPGGPDTDLVGEVASGKSDFGTAFLADLSVAIQKNQPVVSIAQIQQMNGLLLIAKKSSGIKRPVDFVGKRIGIWGTNWETQLRALLARERIQREKVKITPQGFDMQPFLNGDLDVASAMVYNEYHQVLEAGMSLHDLNIIDYVLYGLGFPGDTLFTSRWLAGQNPSLCGQVLRASLRGWQYAIDNPKEAVDIVLKYDKSGTAVRSHQLSMMREISRLVKVPWREMGYTDRTTVQQMINILSRYKVLEGPLLPEAVYTNEFWEQAREK